MKSMRFTGAGIAALFLCAALAACQDVPPNATYETPEKSGVYYEEPTAAEECQDDAGGPECPDQPVGPVEKPERVN